jgi:ribose transport system ATP-binding protein
VYHGEILGLAGLVGAGRTSLARTIFGIDRLVAGEIRIDGEVARIATPRDAIGRGIYLIPEDRKKSGLVLDLPIRENITLADLAHHSRLWLVDKRSETKTARAEVASLSIKAPSVETLAVTLSGGNQQKVVLGKWLAMQPRVVILDEPTRGIDVGAKNEIYALMRRLADNGVAILMISSDMEEVIGVSDRIAVMHEGRVSGLLERDRFSEYNVLRLAIGQTLEPAEAA